MLKNIDIFLCQALFRWFKENGDLDSARFIEVVLGDMDYLFRERENGKTSSSITGIRTDLIPEWYYEWTMNSGLSKEVREKNVESFVQSFSNKAK